MKLFKLCAVAAALSGMALSASAMTSIQDEELSQVSGQDGVSIVADLNINIGSFKYTDTDATGGSVGFNDIKIRGLMVMTIDVLSTSAFQAAAGAAITGVATDNGTTVGSVAGLIGATAIATGYAAGSDVVQFAFPKIGDGVDAHAVSPSITVGSIRTGNGGASFGSFALNQMDLQGTKVWIYGH